MTNLNNNSSNPNQDQLLTRKQAAQFLGVKTNTLAVWHCCKRYDLPYYKIGRSVKYKLSDLENFIAKNQKGLSDE
jgi:predicted DNA-binding transcriptional regulator AlpA